MKYKIVDREHLEFGTITVIYKTVKCKTCDSEIICEVHFRKPSMPEIYKVELENAVVELKSRVNELSKRHYE